MAERDPELYARKLEDPNVDVKTKSNAAVELRDTLEHFCQSATYATFLARFVPIFLKLLEGEPSFMSNTPEQKLRACVLEMIHRLPMSPIEALEPYSVRIVEQLMDLVRLENEDNAILCLKTVMDFHRHQTKPLADTVQRFLDLIQEMFESMEHVVKDTFDDSTQTTALTSTNNTQSSQSPRPNSPAVTSLPGESEQQQTSRPLLKGMQSFKVLAECPIIVVSIFQAYRNVTHENVKKFVPLIKGVLLLQAGPQEKAHEKAEAQGTHFIGVSEDIKNRAAFGEFITAQVKTMSFLAYLLRVYAQQLNDFLPQLPAIVVRLLRDCPKEKSGARKELLVAIRHIINFNFRKIFLKKLDDLLDERTLLGDGLTVYETQRPLAYSLLADLIHHVRESLKPSQIQATIEVYTRNLRDSFPGTSYQTMSAKILLNLAENIASLEDKTQARYFFLTILDAFGDKFAAMNRQYGNAVKLASQFSQQSPDPSSNDYLAIADQPPDWDEIDIFNAAPIKITNPRDRVADPIADNKFLFKVLVNGLKSLFFHLRACNPQLPFEIQNPPANWHEISFGFSPEEVKVLMKLFHEGIKVFQYYKTEKLATDSNMSLADLLASHTVPSSKEEKELLETFATVFHHIDPAIFHEIFHAQIPHLFEMMFDHPALSQVPQFLLASEATSPSFAGMLLQFLMDRIEEVGTADINKATIFLRLFKLSFMAVTLFSSQNEAVLLPHVNKLVTQSIKLSTTAEAPMHYFYLLRSLFRSIGGGRFEHLYKEILPLLEMILEVLNNLVVAARDTKERDLYVELSLTVPARLSNLLPHLSYLMKPLVLALRAGSDLIGQGLRTLELCVDNLTADYLDPIMAPVIDDLMAALWEHLKPSPYSHFHAHTTMRILGKLGGRNRRFLNGAPVLTYQPYSDPVPSIDIKFIGFAKDRSFPASVGVDTALTRLYDTATISSTDLFYKQQALKLIIAEAKLHIESEALPDNFQQLVRLQADDLSDDVFDKGLEVEPLQERERSVAKRDDQQLTLKKLLKGCLHATCVPQLKDEALAFVVDVCKHVTILEVGRAHADAKQGWKAFNTETGEGALYLDSRIIANAIVESLSSDRQEVRAAAEATILAIRDAASVIFGVSGKVNKLPLFNHLIQTFCHSCYEEEWYMKSGGTAGINIMITKLDLGDSWYASRQLDLSRALMYAAKDLPQDLPEGARNQALSTFCTLIRRCNSSIGREEALNVPGKVISLSGFLVSELTHINKHIRDGAQNALNILAEVTGTEVHELVAPVKDRLLTSVFSKPLRALPFAIQIGYIEAIAYCLKLENGILEFNDQLNRFMGEAIHLADQDDDTFGSKPSEQRNFDSIVKLRVSCLNLLTIGLGFPDFSGSPDSQNKPNHQVRPKIIAVFFKSLYNKSQDVIDAAYAGLKTVTADKNRLPKDVLQNGLRPVLVSLQEPKKLSVEGLNGLARLLQLLTNYFKTEIGSRLLDNIDKMVDENGLTKNSFTLIEQSRQIKIIAAIFNIFHLLPPAASTFMPRLIEKVIELENQLRRTHYSPFRAPIIKYLNRYTSESWKYFLPQLRNQVMGRFFAQLLADEKGCGPLREAGLQETQALMDALSSDSSGEERWITIINVIHITDSICAYPTKGDHLLSNDAFRKVLIERGTELEKALRSNNIDPSLSLAAEQAGDRIVDILISRLSQLPEDSDLLFDVIERTATQSLKMTPAITHFIFEAVISNTSVKYLRQTIMRCLDVFTTTGANEKLKAFLFHNLVNPILATDVKRNWNSLIVRSSKGTELVDKSLLDTIASRLWRAQTQNESSDEAVPNGIDHSRMELLQTTTLLLKYHKPLLQDVRKDVIRFGYKYTHLEDVINKQGAYVVLSYFIHQFETPANITMSNYQALLRVHQNEGRSLVTQALEVMAPKIPIRMTGAYARWARFARRIIAEDSSNLQQMLAVFQFIARHPALYYDTKEPFAQIIIPALSKVAQLPSPSYDGKKLALSLMSLIWHWEQGPPAKPEIGDTSTAVDSPQSLKRTRDGSPVAQSPSKSAGPKTFISSTTLRLVLIKYLVQFLISLTDRYALPSAKPRDASHPNGLQAQQSAEICTRAMNLFHDFLSPSFWSDLDIDFVLVKYLKPILTVDPKPDEKFDMGPTRVINSLQMIKIIVNIKPDEWIIDRLEMLQTLLEKPARNSHAEIQDVLHGIQDADNQKRPLVPLIKRIVQAIPQMPAEEDGVETEVPTSEFITFLSGVASEALSSGNHLVGINILSTFSTCRPDEIDQHAGLVMKSFSALTKEHTSVPAPSAPSQPGQQQTEPTPATDLRLQEQTRQLILKTIDLLAVRMAQLGDNRRLYLTALTTLIDKSPSKEICMTILNQMSSWIFDQSDAYPTLKEKTTVMLRMAVFEHRQFDGKPDLNLFHKFLELVIRVYKDKHVTRSELAIRLEAGFLVGTRSTDVEIRDRFMSLFDRHLSSTASKRLLYVLTSQSWECLADTFWLAQVIQLLFGSVEMNAQIGLAADDFKTKSATELFSNYANDPRLTELMLDEEYETFMAQHRRFCASVSDVRARNILEPLCQLQHTDSNVSRNIWNALFPAMWTILAKEERSELNTGMVNLLSKEFHHRQMDKRPNCVQALLEGVVRARPRMNFPHHLAKFLAKTYDAWYVAATLAEENTIHPVVATPAVRESNLDALAEIYAGLQEDDLFYGSWRRRCHFLDTNTALSNEQHGIWDKAQRMYENATVKARTGTVPLEQSEYMLWEDHWVLCAQKLQQWDILTDFAKHDNLNDLFLEAIWRNFEFWNSAKNREQLDNIIKGVSDAPTPRRAFFQSFMALLKLHSDQDPEHQTANHNHFSRITDESIQLSIRKWHQLPKQITNAHIPVLQSFQQLVELHDASVICASLAQTNAANLDHKSPELKLLLGTWRDRLPNFWDDINAWQDLVTWRQHVFNLINHKYLALIAPQQGNATGNSFAYRGYHETAWIINRFAHVARKHQLPEVCINQLSKIYTLPNIEIQEAFLKLREQAKCHYQNPSELGSGLDVINNTNLNYFGQQQKAEFYTLKGMFLAKLNMIDDANEAFGTALYFDLKLPKAWAEWGRYNDQLYKENPEDMSKAVAAVACYLEAAGTYRNSKSRKLLSRVLWLLSLDDKEGQLAKAFESFKGETPLWYWITFIPQLLTSLNRPEARISRVILMKLAKTYPQALYFHLRTTREDMFAIKKAEEAKAAKANASKQGSPSAKQGSPDSRPKTADSKAEGGQPNGTDTAQQSTPAKVEDKEHHSPTVSGQGDQPAIKKPWEYTEEIMSTLKTAFPLLALSMETMVDQTARTFKYHPDEDAYRLVNALISDVIAYVSRSPLIYSPDKGLPSTTEANLSRFASSVLPAHIRKDFEAEFFSKKLNMPEYIEKIRRWRDRFEEKLDRRVLNTKLESYGPLLNEFKFQKFDDVEVPGQYLLHKDKNQDFVRIERFMPEVDLVRGSTVCHRRLRIRGHDGSVHIFAIQYPAHRNSRREERTVQLFRVFNDILAKKKESRRRKLNFLLPAMVPIAPNIRMIQDDPSYISLQGVYEDYCRRRGVSKDEPVLFTLDRLRTLAPRTPEMAAQIRLEAFELIQEKFVPNTVALDYFQSIYPAFADFWLFRRHFSYNLAALSFMTYLLQMKDRTPAKLLIARASGGVWGAEVVPTLQATPGKNPVFWSNDKVPFRLTPNLQILMGPIALEGIFSSAIFVIARALTESENGRKLEQQLSLFIRDEMLVFFNQHPPQHSHQRNTSEGSNSGANASGSTPQGAAGPDPVAQLRDSVAESAKMMSNRAGIMGEVIGPRLGEDYPCLQNVVDMVGKAVDPENLCLMEPLWLPNL